MALQDLLIDELHDLYDAEHQLTKALRDKEPGPRLEEVFVTMGRKASGKHCAGKAGNIEEGSKLRAKDAWPQ